MKCPVCDVELKMADRQGVEIDYCPKCRGVWLDRGELDKIIERSYSFGHAPQHGGDEYRQGKRAHEKQEDYHAHKETHHKKDKSHKRKSLLGDLFDFDF
jgi:Zn-finger nucleic acid-binding protein